MEDFNYWSKYCHEALKVGSLHCYHYGADKLVEILRGENRYADELRLLAFVHFLYLNEGTPGKGAMLEERIRESFAHSGMNMTKALSLISDTIGDSNVPICNLKSIDVIDVYTKILSGNSNLVRRMVQKLSM